MEPMYIYTEFKSEMGALIKFYMWVIKYYKINEEWLRAVCRAVGRYHHSSRRANWEYFYFSGSEMLN